MNEIEIDGSHNFIRTFSPDDGVKGDRIMRNEQQVNVHDYATHAAQRNGGTGSLRDLETEHGEPESPQPWWQRIIKWEDNLTVGNKVIEKGFVVTPAMTLLLVATMISALAYAYKTSTADNRETREAIVRMETMLNERTRSFEREQERATTKIDNEVRMAQLEREKAAKEKMKWTLALKQKGISIDE